jgi:transcriptional regulator with XRE-family HTH domain
MKAFRVLLGERVRDLRLEQGLSLKALGSRVGLHPSHLWKVEHAVVNAKVPTLAAIARGLGIALLDLANVGGDERAEVIEMTRTMSESEIRRLITRLDEDESGGKSHRAVRTEW